MHSNLIYTKDLEASETLSLSGLRLKLELIDLRPRRSIESTGLIG